MTEFPDTGKIHEDFLEKIVFPECGLKRKEVITGPGFGVDVSVVQLRDGMAMAATSDPLTLIPTLGFEESAWLSVHLMASDMATTGFSPMYALFTLNLPPDLKAKDFKSYWNYISEFCKDLNTAIIGGHTGRFEGQNSTVAGGGTMITIAPEKDILTSKGGNAGDDIIVTKECAIISTAVLALSFPETIRNHCGTENLRKAQELFYLSSAVSAALAAVRAGRHGKGVTAMHDVTEGGVCGAIYELAHASDCGAEVATEKIPVGEIQKSVCSCFDIDPMFSVGAGSLIITARPHKSKDVIEQLQREGIPARIVGKLTKKEKGIRLLENGQFRELKHPGEDPYWKAFFNAMKKGLK